MLLLGIMLLSVATTDTTDILIRVEQNRATDAPVEWAVVDSAGVALEIGTTPAILRRPLTVPVVICSVDGTSLVRIRLDIGRKFVETASRCVEVRLRGQMYSASGIPDPRKG